MSVEQEWIWLHSKDHWLFVSRVTVKQYVLVCCANVYVQMVLLHVHVSATTNVLQYGHPYLFSFQNYKHW